MEHQDISGRYSPAGNQSRGAWTLPGSGSLPDSSSPAAELFCSSRETFPGEAKNSKYGFIHHDESDENGLHRALSLHLLYGRALAVLHGPANGCGAAPPFVS